MDRVDPGDTGFSAGGQSFAYYYPKEVLLKSPQRDPQEKALTAYITSFNTAISRSTPRSRAHNSTNPMTGYSRRGSIFRPPSTTTSSTSGRSMSMPFASAVTGTSSAAESSWRGRSGISTARFRRPTVATRIRKSGDPPAATGGTDFFNYTWWTKLFRDPDFYQKYIDRWQDLRRPGQPYSPANVQRPDRQLECGDQRRGDVSRSWRGGATASVRGPVRSPARSIPARRYTTSGANSDDHRPRRRRAARRSPAAQGLHAAARRLF